MKKRFFKPKPVYFPLLILMFIFLQLLIGKWIESKFDCLEQMGQFGDMYGFVNALFSGLALAGAVYALMVQQDELYNQRIQSEVQSFENNLFQMLNLHNDIVNNLEHGGKRGRSVFQVIMVDFITNINISTQYLRDEKDKEEIRERINNLYDGTCIRFVELGHYFRNLYHIIKFIDKSNIEDKKRYTSIVRAQLSGSEQILLLFNCIYRGGAKFHPFVEEYSLLENMTPFSEQDKYKLLFYKNQAFGEDAT